MAKDEEVYIRELAVPASAGPALVGNDEVSVLEAQIAAVKKRQELEQQLLALRAATATTPLPVQAAAQAAAQPIVLPELPAPTPATPQELTTIDTLERDLTSREKKKSARKSIVAKIPGVRGVVGSFTDLSDYMPGDETPPGELTGKPADAFEAAAAKYQRNEGDGVMVPTPNLASPEDQLIGETESFEDYNRFQKIEATASDLESLIMLERAIMKGEQRKAGESNPMKWVTVLIGGGVGLVIVLFLAKDLGLFAF